jgi:Type I phosphodiesterase / nucleotide pyrophosphatase
VADGPRSRAHVPRLIASAVLAGALAIGVSWWHGVLLGAIVGAMVLAVGLRIGARPAGGDGYDSGRRRLLTWAALGGLMWVAGGAAIGRAIRRIAAPDTGPILDEMAHGLGSEYMQLLHRTYRPGRAGELQLLLAPFNSSNYENESTSLVPRDPRTSHASVWMYLERIPLAVYAPGMVDPATNDQRVTLADIAPTIAQLISFDGWPNDREGRPLPGLAGGAVPPKAVVVFVIDGGGWNVLEKWSAAWPHTRDVFAKSMLYRNAIHGSFPAVTACAHATIGTGTFPRDHGITGHNIRDGSGVRKTYGTPGRAQPSDILLPTLADLWYDADPGRTWVGEIGYQVWHLGMLGRGGTKRPAGDKPVAVYWDELRKLGDARQWQPHNPDLYRLPREMPGLDVFDGHKASYAPNAPPPNIFDPQARQVDCCSPPIVQYEGDLIDATIRSEGIGTHEKTDLLFINFKSPDYTGHIYNFLDDHERIVLEAVDAEIGRLVSTLESMFAPGEFVLFLTADHGQCPLPDTVNGARLDPVQLQADIERAFGRTLFGVVQYVAPSEVFLDRKGLWDAGVSADEVAAFLRNYRYRDNIGPYVPRAAIERNLMDDPEFAGLFGADYLESLTPDRVVGFGQTKYPDADPGIPDYLSW